MGRENQKTQMDASYNYSGKPEYKDVSAESAEDLSAYYGNESQDAQNKPYYSASKDRGYTEYR